MISDPSFQLRAAQMEAMVADPNLKTQDVAAQVDHVVEHIGEMTAEMANPNFQRLAKSVAEHMGAIIKDPNFQMTVQHVTAQMQALVADPNLKKQADHVVEQMNEMAATGVETMAADPYLIE